MDTNTDEAKGKFKEVAGHLTGNEKLESEGKADRASGDVKRAADNVADKAEDLVDKVKDAVRKD